MLGSPSLGAWGALLVWVWGRWAPTWGVGPVGFLVRALGKYLDPAGDRDRCGPQNLAYEGTKISEDRPRGLSAQGVTSDLVTCGPIQDVLAQGFYFYFDSHLTFSDQISSLSKSCYYHIRELRSIRHYLNFKTASTIATSIVHSKLDYCNSLYYNLPKSQTNRLQVIQNSLARLCLRLPNSVTSPLFSNLYIGLKSTNALNINFFLLPIKLLPLLNFLICTV